MLTKFPHFEGTAVMRNYKQMENRIDSFYFDYIDQTIEYRNQKLDPIHANYLLHFKVLLNSFSVEGSLKIWNISFHYP